MHGLVQKQTGEAALKTLSHRHKDRQSTVIINLTGVLKTYQNTNKLLTATFG